MNVRNLSRATARRWPAVSGAWRAAAIAFSPLAATLSHAGRPVTKGRAVLTVPLHNRVSRRAGTIANSDRINTSRVRKRS